MSKCPICAAPAKSRQDNSAFPFCTTRCKTIDLGKWMSEEYRIPVPDSSPDDEEGSAPAPGSKLGSETEDPVRH